MSESNAWAALNAERERTEALKAQILKKHSAGASAPAVTQEQKKAEAVSLEGLSREQVKTYLYKKQVHMRRGLPAPEPPKSLGFKEARENRAVVKPFDMDAKTSVLSDISTGKVLGMSPTTINATEIRARREGRTKKASAPSLTIIASERLAQKTGIDLDVLDSDIPPEISGEEASLPEISAPTVPEISANDTSVLGLATLMSTIYGIEWTQWEPETIRTTLRDKGVLLDSIDGLLAFALCMVSNAPWTDWPVTEKVIVALNERTPQMATREHVSPAELSHAITIMRSIRKVEWAPEVLAWVAGICHHHGLVWLPPPLGIAQEELSRLNGNRNMTMEVMETWIAIENDGDLEDFPFREDFLGIQLSRLASMKMYCQAMGSE